jgi:hypothetical protein
VYRLVGDFTNAYISGQKALKLYEKRKDRRLEAQIHQLLGLVCHRLGEFKEASDHYTQSLAIATILKGPTMVMYNCVSLAELRLAEGRIEEARNYCDLALENLGPTSSNHTCGVAYHIVANVTYQEAQQLEGTERFKTLGEAEKWYAKAIEEFSHTQAYQDIADTYREWGQLLEDMLQPRRALECWRKSYEVLEHRKDMKA